MIAFLEDLKGEGFDKFWYIFGSEPDFSQLLNFSQSIVLKTVKQMKKKKHHEVLIFYAAFIKILIGSYELKRQC